MRNITCAFIDSGDTGYEEIIKKELREKSNTAFHIACFMITISFVSIAPTIADCLRMTSQIVFFLAFVEMYQAYLLGKWKCAEVEADRYLA